MNARNALVLLAALAAASTATAEDKPAQILDKLTDKTPASFTVIFGDEGSQRLTIVCRIEDQRKGGPTAITAVTSVASVAAVTTTRSAPSLSVTASRPKRPVSKPTWNPHDLRGYAFKEIRDELVDRDWEGAKVRCHRVSFVFTSEQTERVIEWLSPPAEGAWKSQWAFRLDSVGLEGAPRLGKEGDLGLSGADEPGDFSATVPVWGKAAKTSPGVQCWSVHRRSDNQNVHPFGTWKLIRKDGVLKLTDLDEEGYVGTHLQGARGK